MIQPGNILGQYDLGSWSRLFGMLKAGKLPGVFPGGAPWCHIDGVVAAHIAAAESGAAGDTYLIGGQYAKYTDVIASMAEMTGAKVPPKLPRFALKAVGQIGNLVSRFNHKTPDVTPEIAYFGLIDYRADCTKAQNELGYREVSIEQMLNDAYRWLKEENRI